MHKLRLIVRSGEQAKGPYMRARTIIFIKRINLAMEVYQEQLTVQLITLITMILGIISLNGYIPL